jgi:hypothetical protein
VVGAADDAEDRLTALPQSPIATPSGGYGEKVSRQLPKL